MARKLEERDWKNDKANDQARLYEQMLAQYTSAGNGLTTAQRNDLKSIEQKENKYRREARKYGKQADRLHGLERGRSEISSPRQEPSATSKIKEAAKSLKTKMKKSRKI